MVLFIFDLEVDKAQKEAIQRTKQDTNDVGRKNRVMEKTQSDEKEKNQF